MSVVTKMIDGIKTAVSQKKKKYFVSALILAGGKGERAGGNVPKQFAEICGMETAARAVLAFENCPLIDEIIIVARKGEGDHYREMCRKYGFSKVTRVVHGGADRRGSAERGAMKINKKAEFVAIHDAARCLVTPELIEKTARAAFACGAAAPCRPLSDTVKEVNDKGYVVNTPPRSSLRAVETPQIFRAELYSAAVYFARKKELEVTDDCSLVESLGYAVKLVESDGTNIKITYPGDIERAEYILRERERAGRNER